MIDKSNNTEFVMRPNKCFNLNIFNWLRVNVGDKNRNWKIKDRGFNQVHIRIIDNPTAELQFELIFKEYFIK